MSRSVAIHEGPTSPVSRGGPLRETSAVLSILDHLLVHYGPRDFAIRLWDGTTVPADAGQETSFTLVLNRPGVLRRMLLPPNELALGESYLDGDWDLEGDIIAAMRLGDLFEDLAMRLPEWLSMVRLLRMLPVESPSSDHRVQSFVLGRQRARLAGSEHSQERDRDAISYHYDVGNDFYSSWLDRRMIYSCAYFETGEEELDRAQEAKLDLICRKLRLQPGERLLDIGCGWGGLIQFAAERYGVKAVGITLSQPQADLANQRIAAAGLSDRCEAVILDYRDVTSLPAFDKVVSVGMVEHVGKAKLGDYFAAAYSALKPGGLFLSHGITAAGRDRSANLLDRYVFHRGAFMAKYVFPDGEVYPVGDSLSVAERAGFEVRDVESLREHYALTLRHWVGRLESNLKDVLNVVDERTYRVWRLYMAGCSYAFKTGRLSIHQSLLSKLDDRGESHMPRTRGYIYP